jgi:hypothetical protein
VFVFKESPHCLMGASVMPRLFRSKYLEAALTLVVLAGGRLGAQEQPNPNLRPTYGSVKLKAGFLPDPFTKDVQAGGRLRTSLGGVKAYVAKAPDFSLHYTAGKYPLTFTAKSVGDTTLLINLPDGSWVADDDSGGGLDPLIRIDRPQSGRYDIYVGTYQSELVASTLHITERGAAQKPKRPFNPNLPECFIVSVGVDNYLTQNKLKGCLNDARNTVAAFRDQTGAVFRRVNERLLLDDGASHGAIMKAFRNLTTQGAAGDSMVLFLSGHGARTNGNRGDTWFFLPVDFQPGQFANTAFTDKQILDIGDQLVRQKKNVIIIVDACFAGQLGVTAQPYLRRYKDRNQGGMALMLSSAPHQESTALGNYSAFAKAFFDSMNGAADLNRDTKITFSEIQTYSIKRTSDLLVAARSTNKQNAIVNWSPSLSGETALGYAGKASGPVAGALPKEAPRRFAGNETLPGYGKLSFALYSNGRAVMVDAKSTMEGIWRQQGNQYTLAFANGSVIYTGTLSGATLSGTATSPAVRQQGRQSWTWTVRQQAG